jgi:hypothetical protein
MEGKWCMKIWGRSELEASFSLLFYKCRQGVKKRERQHMLYTGWRKGT